MTNEPHSSRPFVGRVLHVTDCYTGGVSRAIDCLAQNAKSWEHLIAYRGGDRPAPGVYSEQFPVTGGTIRRLREFRGLVRATKPDVIHAHSSWAGGFVRVGPSLGVPVVYQPHCYKFVDPSLPSAASLLLRHAERLMLTNTKQTVVLSSAEAVAAASIGAVHVHELPNVPYLPACSAAPSRARRLFMIGRLTAQKDPDYFIQVFRAARQHVPSLSATWIGDGEAGRRLALEAAGIRVTGWMDAPSMGEVLGAGGVYVHSARYEGFPISVLDAAQAGLPIMLRRTPSFAGIDLPQYDHPNELAEAAVRVIDNATAWQVAVDRARRLLAYHTNAQQAHALERIYSSVIQA